MKLVTYSPQRESDDTRAGLLWGEWIVDVENLPGTAEKLGAKASRTLKKVSKDNRSVLDVLSKGPAVLEELQSLSWRVFNRTRPGKEHQTLRRLAETKLRAPIPNPPSLRDFYAFEAHVKAARARRGLDMVPEWYEIPAFYYSNHNAVRGPEDEIPVPSYTKSMDFELEIACVIGRPGRNIPVQEAESYIAGYTIMNDWSARDVQTKEMKIGLGPAKAKDFATTLGPWLVTPDELEDRRIGPGKYRLEMSARLNAKQVSKGNMEDIHWTFPQMIARASEDVLLRTGDVIGSGTVGTGSLMEHQGKRPRWLKPGDIVELEIERLGVLRNRVIEPETVKKLTS